MSITVHRLHKYDPALYDEDGFYTRVDDEWTSIHDVGRVFHDGVLTRAAYMAVEDAYVSALELIMKAAGVTRLRVFRAPQRFQDLSEFDEWAPEIGAAESLSYRDAEWIEGERLANYCRLSLRDLDGFRLSNETDFFLFFPGSMYVEVGTQFAPASLKGAIERLGLHLVERGPFGQGMNHDVHAELLPRAHVAV